MNLPRWATPAIRDRARQLSLLELNWANGIGIESFEEKKYNF
jgi:hypothetical protein